MSSGVSSRRSAASGGSSEAAAESGSKVVATGLANILLYLTKFVRSGVQIAIMGVAAYLVIDGAIHPVFIEGSSDRTRRTGVGVSGPGMVHFAISERQVNFYDFARFFRDFLGCRNALFLDGGRGTGLYSPVLGRNDISWHGGFGPIVGVVE